MKYVTFNSNISENTIIKRPCECQGCINCKDKLIQEGKHHCNTFGQFKCDTCHEWRCTKCMTVWTCKYCKRIL